MVIISYNKLWKLLIDLDFNKTRLRKETGIGTSTVARMVKGEPVGLEVLAKICYALKCNIEDIVEFEYEK